MKKKLRLLVLVHEDLVPPESAEGCSPEEIALWRTEYDVIHQLNELGHEVRALGVQSDLGVIRQAIEEFRPDLAFNLLEEFHGIAVYDQHVVSYLELMKTPYTGCNPRGLMLAHDKALCRKILAFHRIPGPHFGVFRMNRKITIPKRLPYPLFVKSAVEDASMGISQASIVADAERLEERVHFIHTKVGTDALVEEYIEGRELYAAVIGNQRLQTFPVLEMSFSRLPEGAPAIATAKVKWDETYQEKIGMEIAAAKGIPSDVIERIARITKRVYRILGLSGYARLDLRLDAENTPHVIEVNPNPDLAIDDLFADAAVLAGLDYPTMIRRILSLGMRYRAQWRASET